jgi:hypothetical protein
LGKSTGLHDVSIAYSAWDVAQSQLIIAYNNSNIDIVKGDQVYAITDLLLSNLYPSKKTKGVMLLIFDILENLLKNGVSNEELKIAKGHIKGHLISRLNNTNAISLLNGLDLLYDCNECVPMDKLYDTFYHKITCADIHSAIKRYITRDNMTIVLLGCDKTYPKLKPFIMRNLPRNMVTHK